MSHDDFHSVDQDWKAHAEAERRKLQEKLDAQKIHTPEYPPASFMTLMSTFVTHAMLALGEIEMPEGQERKLDLPAARFAIDTLSVLKEKTAGNLSEVESRALDEVLQSLRLHFVGKSRAQPPGAGN